MKYITQALGEMSLSLTARTTSGPEPIQVIFLVEVLPMFARVWLTLFCSRSMATSTMFLLDCNNSFIS
jgi:hypothetical protein